MANETKDPSEIPPDGGTGEPEETAFYEMDVQERMKWLRIKAREHLWGPTGSILLHFVLILLAIQLFKGSGTNNQTEIEVIMMDPNETKLDDIKELEKLIEPEQEMEMPEFDVVMDAPPDVDPMDNAQPQEDFTALDIRTDVQSPLIMRGLFAGRSASGRVGALKKYGGKFSGATESSVMRALEWLKEHQLEDGSWEGESSARCKTAMTGLGLLTFLAHGETPTSERYGKTVEKAIRFLVEVDAKGDGNFTYVDGSMYAQGIAAYALAEAFALTRIPSIKPVMEASIARIIQGQQSTGAFNYGLVSADARRDTSVAGWMTQAMKAAYIGGASVTGLKEAMDLAVQGFKVNYDAETALFRYAPGDPAGDSHGSVSPSVTPIGILCLQLLGHANDAEVSAGLNSIAPWEVSWTEKHPSSWPLYTWYYATQAFFQSGGKNWDRWNSMFARMLVTNQNADGSWTPNGASEGTYGPVYATTLSALSLMVYYRFLPTYQPIEVEEAPKENQTDDILPEVTLATF
jgi:hypothetical protein